LGLGKWKRKKFGKAMGSEIGYKVEGVKIRISDLGFRIRDLRRIEGEKVRRWEGVKVIEGGPKICRRIGVVTGGFGDLDQVVQAGLDTLITGEADYPTEVKAKELGINLILGGHRETEVFGVRVLGKALKSQRILRRF
jgi:putative NIF3 family GTP cyclohydrolase 1 type 2